MTRLRGAVIGCGNISEFHLRGWQRIPEVEIRALCDPDRGRAERRRAEFFPAARLYDGMDALLAAEQLDFVDIITPPWLHRAQCLQAAAAGLHVVCQKPLCDRFEDAAALVAEMARHSRRFVVHENHRFRPWFREILDLARDSFFGPLRYLEFSQHDPTEPPEVINTAAERGVLLQYGVHLLDMVVALLGDPVRVQASTVRLNPRVHGESLANVVCSYPGASAAITISWKAAGVQQGHALVVGEKGEAYYEGRLTRAESARFRICQGSQIVRDERRSPTDDYVHSFYQFERDFVDSILRDAPPPQPAVENLRSLAAAFAAYESARTGEPVDFAEFRRHASLP